MGPWRLDRGAWLACGVRTVRAAASRDYGMIASAIAFASFLSLLPLLGAVALCYGMITPPEGVIRHIRSLAAILPGESSGFVGDWLIESITRSEGRSFGLLVSVSLALFGALRAGRSIIAGLNIASDIGTGRGFFGQRAVAFIIVLSGAGLLLGALFALSALALLENALDQRLVSSLPVLKAAFWIAATLGASALLALVYRFAPHRPPPAWRWVAPGALVATALWLLATLAFGFYLRSVGHFESTYGSLGAIVALQIWLFLCGYILLLGARLNFEVLRHAEGCPSL